MSDLGDRALGQLRRAAVEPCQGDVVDARFELLEVIGEGGMGVVWEAQDRRDDRRVALKLLIAEGENLDERFARESASLAAVSHPVIVRPVASGRAGGVHYVAMELLRGCSLAHKLGEGCLSVPETLLLGGRVAGGLAALHAAGLTHRDVKPSNIFLPDGLPGGARLLDFGLVKTRGGPYVTRTGALVGTPGYMAPEQVRGERDVQGPADVFALGCVLFECLTGRAAFTADTGEALFARILLEEAPALRDLRADVPQALETLIVGMLRKEASARPASDSLSTALLALGVQANPDSEASRDALPAGLAAGAVVASRYRIERKLGEGGMGVVLAARHLELGKLVAIKLLRSDGSRSDEARFLREGRAASRLESEHVARVLDVGRLDDGAPFLVMEYLSGVDLARKLEREGKLPVEEAVGYVMQACDAIAEAHALGIIHRDIKPSNLFVASRRDGSAVLKVLDFGISKLTVALEGATNDPMSMTGTASAMGSAWYMSPEQLKDSRSVDPRTDIWSLGVVLYQLLSGVPPFEADNPAAVGARIATAEPAALRTVRPETPAALEAVVHRCLRKNPEERYPDVGSLAKTLEPFASRPESREPPSPAPPPRHWAKGLIAGLAGAVAATIVIAAALRGSVGTDASPRPTDPTASAPGRATEVPFAATAVETSRPVMETSSDGVADAAAAAESRETPVPSGPPRIAVGAPATSRSASAPSSPPVSSESTSKSRDLDLRDPALLER